MAKTKSDRGVANKHFHARASYLYQAASYLTTSDRFSPTFGPITNARSREDNNPIISQVASHAERPGQKRTVQFPAVLALQLGSDLRAMSLKGQIRLSLDLKRSMCKGCNSVLIPGKTSSNVVENPSRGGKKPWADVLAIECHTCRSKARFPVGSQRQTKKAARVSKARKEDNLGPMASVSTRVGTSKHPPEASLKNNVEKSPR